MNARDRVADTEIRTYRHFTRMTIHVSKSADPFANRCKTRLISVGPVLSIPGNSCVHQPGIGFLKLLRTEAPTLDHARAKVLDHHIGAIDQFPDQCHPLFCFQINGHRFFISRQRIPPKRSTILQLAPSTNRVTAIGWLDFDHLGTKIAQHTPGKRTCQQLT